MEDDSVNLKELLAAELDDLALVLLEEPKNYHAWQYRQWLICLLAAHVDPTVEMGYLKECIHKDPFNNSAWSHRFFIYNKFNSPPEVEANLVKIVLEMIGPLGTINQALLNYVHGTKLHHHGVLDEAHKLSYQQLFGDN